MSPPAPSEAAPPPLPGPPDEYVGEGCPPGVDPTTCCVCSDHTQFEDPSHPHYHRFNDRALADELLEYLLEKERALDAERAELIGHRDVDDDDEDGIDDALDADEDHPEILDRVVRPLPARGLTAARPPTPDDDDSDDEPESPTLAEMAFGPPPTTLRSAEKLVVRPAPATGVEVDGRGRLKLGGLGGGSRWAQRQQQEDEEGVTDRLAALAVDDVEDDDSFHLTSTNLSKKRKIPSPFAGDHSPSGRASPSPQLPTEEPAVSQDGGPSSSSYLFPSFPALPVGYTRQIPPLPYALRTRLVLARVSPSCRANIWAKAIWAERRLIIGRLGARLTADEAWAVEYAGVGWGKGLLSEAVDAAHPKLRKEDSRRARRGGMRGVQQKLSKDGLSLYAVVREEADWTAKKVARKGIGRLASFAFTFTTECEGPSSPPAIDEQQPPAPAMVAPYPPPPRKTHIPTIIGPTPSSRAAALARSAEQKKEKTVCVGRAAEAKKKKKKKSKVAGGDDQPTDPAPAIEPVAKLSGKPSSTVKLGGPASARASSTVERSPSDVSSTTGDGNKPRVTATGANPAPAPSPSPPPLPPPTGGGGKKKTGKKKRSALANASNPHHMKNYVPTRLVSDQPSQAFNPHAFMASLFFPPPTRLLSAAPAKYKAAAAALPAGDDGSAAPGTEEYLCVFCEHTLLYSSSAEGRRKLVSKRKKMLARKQRARERASGVANGTKTFGSGTGGGSKQIRKVEQEDEDEYDGDDWECDDEILPNGQCRRCAERRAHELDRKQKKAKKKKKAPEQAGDAVTNDPAAA